MTTQSHSSATHTSTITSPSRSRSPSPAPPPALLPRTLHGSCHCGLITYTVDVALPLRPHLPLANRCNCRICLKTGFTSLSLPNDRESFRLLTPESLEGEGNGVVDYVTGSKVENREVHRWFCGRCGVMVCAGGWYVVGGGGGKERGGEGEGDEEGGHEEGEGEGGGEGGEEEVGAEDGEGNKVQFFNINLVTLDQPQEGLDLSVFKMQYADGRNDNWMAGFKDSPWSGGVV